VSLPIPTTRPSRPFWFGTAVPSQKKWCCSLHSIPSQACFIPFYHHAPLMFLQRRRCTSARHCASIQENITVRHRSGIKDPCLRNHGSCILGLTKRKISPE